MERTYLYVPPEEYAEVKASGACWDDASKRWYTGEDPLPPTLLRWRGDDAAGENEAAEFTVTSDEGFVAAAHVVCLTCQEMIEVICIYCENGFEAEMGEMMEQVTLSNVWALDSALAAQLERWRQFKPVAGSEGDDGYFANHCPHCGAVQEDYLLHAEPGDVFFCIPEAEPGTVELTALVGRIRLSGDTSFGV
jgi:hypothetical protein